LPEFDDPTAARAYIGLSLQTPQGEPQPLGRVEHAFTHFDLVITPLLTRCAGSACVMDAARSVWYNTREPARIGLPAPIKALLEDFASPALFDGRVAG
jgi:A/G-specific adenine glycosylase